MPASTMAGFFFALVQNGPVPTETSILVLISLRTSQPVSRSSTKTLIR